MARATNSPAPAADDLNAEGIVPVIDTSAEDDDVIVDDGPEFVVLKGNMVRHNGEVYRENSVIPVTGQDAERLLQAGIIADVHILRQRAQAAQPSVTVTSG